MSYGWQDLLSEGGANQWNSGVVAGLQRRPPVQSCPEILPVILDGLTEAQFLILQVDLLLTTQGLGAWKWWGSGL